MRKRITLKDIYLGYDYKTYDTRSNTIPVPYFSKDEISDHKYALTYKEWKKIIFCYLKHLVKYLLTGKLYIIPLKLGTFRLMKFKPKKKGIDFNKTMKQYGDANSKLPVGEKKLVYFLNHHTHGYHPFFMWDRWDVRFPFKWHWKLDLSRRGVWPTISNAIMKDITIINKLHQR